MTRGGYENKTGYMGVDLYLDLAILLYEAGATVQRVSDSVRWLAQSLGDEKVHLFVGYEAIELSVHHGDHMENRLYVLREPSRVKGAVLHQVSGKLHRIPSYHGDITAIHADISDPSRSDPCRGSMCCVWVA